MKDQVIALNQEMKGIRYLDYDKVTYGTYYQSLLLSQNSKDEQGNLGSGRKNSYIQSDEYFDQRSSLGIQRGKDDDFDDFFNKKDDQSSNGMKQTNSRSSNIS